MWFQGHSRLRAGMVPSERSERGERVIYSALRERASHAGAGERPLKPAFRAFILDVVCASDFFCK